MTGPQFALLASASVFMSCAYFLVTVAVREGAIAVIAPFRYSALIFSSVLGPRRLAGHSQPYAWS